MPPFGTGIAIFDDPDPFKSTAERNGAISPCQPVFHKPECFQKLHPRCTRTTTKAWLASADLISTRNQDMSPEIEREARKLDLSRKPGSATAERPVQDGLHLQLWGSLCSVPHSGSIPVAMFPWDDGPLTNQRPYDNGLSSLHICGLSSTYITNVDTTLLSKQNGKI